jgi:isopenicillin-N epimerase
MFHSDIGGAQIDREKIAQEWNFGGADYMNHGSFGACPRTVREFQQKQHEALLRNPMDYFSGEHIKNMTENRLFWAQFTGADPEGIVHVECATQAVNTVLKSLALRGYFKSGDEILFTSHGYNACNNAAREIAELTGAVVTVAQIPFPIAEAGQVTEAILKAVTPKTRFALIDHITSETALVYPIHDIVTELKQRGVETLVDGAHAPAHVPIALEKLGAAFYTGNGHKWLCAAPGCAFLYVRADFQGRIRPLSTSHGANDPNPDISAFQKNFAWIGTRDTTAWSTPKVAFDTLSGFHHEGLPGLIDDNKKLLHYGYSLLLEALNQKPHTPDDMLGTMATLILPRGNAETLRAELRRSNFVTQLWNTTSSVSTGRALRLSAQAYNTPEQYERLAAALVTALKRER